MAPTLVYDALIMHDSAVPTDVLAQVPVQTLALHSTASPDWLANATAAAAAGLPNARLASLEGEFHQANTATMTGTTTSRWISVLFRETPGRRDWLAEATKQVIHRPGGSSRLARRQCCGKQQVRHREHRRGR